MDQNDVDDDDDENEMRIFVPSMPDQRNGKRKQGEMNRQVLHSAVRSTAQHNILYYIPAEMIRQRCGFCPLLHQTRRNDVTRNDMKDERK